MLDVYFTYDIPGTAEDKYYAYIYKVSDTKKGENEIVPILFV